MYVEREVDHDLGVTGMKGTGDACRVCGWDWNSHGLGGNCMRPMSAETRIVLAIQLAVREDREVREDDLRV